MYMAVSFNMSNTVPEQKPCGKWTKIVPSLVIVAHL